MTVEAFEVGQHRDDLCTVGFRKRVMSAASSYGFATLALNPK